MKFSHCFVDEKGNIWRDSTLIEASKNIRTEQFKLSNISLDEVLRWKISNIRDHIAHYKRIRDADLTKPIILRSDGYPMDGWHRIIKALILNWTYIRATRFKIDPEPDFIDAE